MIRRGKVLIGILHGGAQQALLNANKLDTACIERLVYQLGPLPQ